MYSYKFKFFSGGLGEFIFSIDKFSFYVANSRGDCCKPPKYNKMNVLIVDSITVGD